MKNKITKANFLAWLRKQPATREFEYMDHGKCLFASFLSERYELRGVRCGGTCYLTSDGLVTFPPWMEVLSSRAYRQLNPIFTVSDVRKLLKN